MESISIKTSIKADVAKVWRYWTDSAHIINWNFASDEWRCPKAQNDLQDNGEFSWRMEAKNGSMGFDFEGTYDKIVDQKFISYRMLDGRKVDITFSQNENEVIVNETFDAEGTNSDEQQRAGWQAILGNFKRYVESEKKSTSNKIFKASLPSLPRKISFLVSGKQNLFSELSYFIAELLIFKQPFHYFIYIDNGKYGKAKISSLSAQIRVND